MSLLSGLRSAIGDIEALLFPPVCHVCGCSLLEGERFLCSGCSRRLPRTFHHLRPMNPVEQRLAGQVDFLRAASWLFYSPDSVTARLIHDFKYRNYPGLAYRLGTLMASDLLESGFLDDAEVVIPMPLHWTKRMRRGYNQCEHIARGIASVAPLQISTLLKATRPHRTQTSLTHEQRHANTFGIFRLHHPQTIEGRGLLLIDDVCTTGATLISAATEINACLPDNPLTILTLASTF